MARSLSPGEDSLWVCPGGEAPARPCAVPRSYAVRPWGNACGDHAIVATRAPLSRAHVRGEAQRLRLRPATQEGSNPLLPGYCPSRLACQS
jgi:hypothetical protein